MTQENAIISRADAEHVAKLAHLRFNEEEMADCTEKLASILAYMQELHKIDTSGVPLTTHVLPLTNVFREDIPGPTLPREKALANAAETEDGSFKVPKIL